MRAGRRADIDDVHVRRLDHLAPIGHRALDAICRCRALHPVAVTPADQTKPRTHRQLADVRGERVAVAVRLAHHPVADDPDADLASRGAGAGTHPGTATDARTCVPVESAAAASSATVRAATASAPSAP